MGLPVPPFQPTTPDEHFALQRTTNAAEAVNAVGEARYKVGEINRAANERFYNSLALFSGGTVALSVTYLGYLKTLSKPVQHPGWLMASWVLLMTCAVCSLFWTFVYGRYTHYSLERHHAEALKEKHEIDAEEFGTLSRNAQNVTPALVDKFRTSRLEAAASCEKNAKDTERLEKRYMSLWRWLGWTGHAGFLLGLALLLAFAIKNM
jgi:hypothetical protein